MTVTGAGPCWPRWCAGADPTSPGARTRDRSSPTPAGDSAGRLIETAGAKGASDRHGPSVGPPRQFHPVRGRRIGCRHHGGDDRGQAPGGRDPRHRLGRRDPLHRLRSRRSLMTAAVAIDPRLRARRTAVLRAEGRRRLRILILALAVMGGLVGAWAVSRSPLLDVDRVTISGVDAADAALVRRAAGVAEGEPLLGLDSTAIERAVSGLAWVAGARVHRDWPGTVSIEVVPRVPVAVVPLRWGFGPARRRWLRYRSGHARRRFAFDRSRARRGARRGAHRCGRGSGGGGRPSPTISKRG